jgi:hypothetical protein
LGVSAVHSAFTMNPCVLTLIYRDFVDKTIGANFVHMHLHHDPIPSLPPRDLFDYTHPSGEVFDPFVFDPSIGNSTLTRDGSTALFCPGRENEVRRAKQVLHRRLTPSCFCRTAQQGIPLSPTTY